VSRWTFQKGARCSAISKVDGNEVGSTQLRRDAVGQGRRGALEASVAPPAGRKALRLD
jgi:hypothetical protein